MLIFWQRSSAGARPFVLFFGSDHVLAPSFRADFGNFMCGRRPLRGKNLRRGPADTRSWIVFVGRIGATSRAAQGRPERRLLPAGVLLSVCDIGPVHEPASSSSSLAAPGEAAADEKLCVIFGMAT